MFLLLAAAFAAEGWVDPTALPQTRKMNHQAVVQPAPITQFKVEFLTASPWTTPPGVHWPCDAFTDFCRGSGTWQDFGSNMLDSGNFNWMRVNVFDCDYIPSTPGWFTGTIHKESTCMLAQQIQDSDAGLQYNWNLHGDIGSVECVWEWTCSGGICEPEPTNVMMLTSGNPACDSNWPGGPPVVTYVSPGSDPMGGVISSLFIPIASWWEI